MYESVYSEVLDDAGRRWALALLEASVQLFAFSLLFFAAVGKLVEFGFFAYIIHFTNWSWSLQAFFYLATLPAPFILVGLLREDSAISRFVQVVLVVVFFPLNGIVFVVVVVVSVLLGTNAPFLTDILARLPPTIVMLGNDVFHFWPVVIILIYYIAYHRLIHFALNRALTTTGVLSSPWRTTAFILYEAYVGSATAIFVYSLIFDPHEVYKTDIWTLSGIVVSAIVLTVFNLLPLMAILALLRVGTNKPYSVRWLVRNDDDPELYILPLTSSARATPLLLAYSVDDIESNALRRVPLSVARSWLRAKQNE